MKTIEDIKYLMVGKGLITDLADLLRANDEEFAESEKNYLAAVEILRKELPPGSSPTLDDYLAACESDVISAVAYAGYLGFRVNLENFHDDHRAVPLTGAGGALFPAICGAHFALSCRYLPGADRLRRDLRRGSGRAGHDVRFACADAHRHLRPPAGKRA